MLRHVTLKLDVRLHNLSYLFDFCIFGHASIGIILRQNLLVIVVINRVIPSIAVNKIRENFECKKILSHFNYLFILNRTLGIDFRSTPNPMFKEYFCSLTSILLCKISHGSQYLRIWQKVKGVCSLETHLGIFSIKIEYEAHKLFENWSRIIRSQIDFGEWRLKRQIA